VGYGDVEQAEGWQLLLTATGYTQRKPNVDPDANTRQAITALDDWDETGFCRISAALERLHPAQDAIVFAAREATRGPSAVLDGAKLHAHLDALKRGTEEDRAAFATFDKRVISVTLCQHLSTLVHVTQTVKPTRLSSNDPKQETVQLARERLHAWYRDWSETALDCSLSRSPHFNRNREAPHSCLVTRQRDYWRSESGRRSIRRYAFLQTPIF
jgi:hypothetical protein